MVQIVEDDDHPQQQNQNQNQNHQKKQSNPEEEEEFLEMESSPLQSNQSAAQKSSSPEKYPPVIPVTERRLAASTAVRGFSPVRSPSTKPIPLPEFPSVPEQTLSSVVVVSRSIGPQVATMSKVDPGEDSFSEVREGGAAEDGGGRPSRTVSSILWRQRREAMVKRAALGFRVCEIVLCLISFSIMAADKTRGWAGDSFDRYKEYKFCLSVTVIAFVYAGFQGYDMAVHLVTGKHIIQHHHRYYFDFSMDQIFTYLLLAASTASATRSNIWVSNWGKDKFTEMANASAAMSFLAFTAFSLSSLISGYYLCTHSYN